MKHRVSGIMAFLCLWASSLTLAAPPDLEAVNQYVQREIERDRVPGVAVALVQGGQATILTYGQDGQGRPITPQTGFILGSMSKSFTALALMQHVAWWMVTLIVLGSVLGGIKAAWLLSLAAKRKP